MQTYLSSSGLGAVLVKAVIGSAGLRIAGMGFSFLVGVQLARGLGAEGYGVYGVAMSIIALLTVPTEFGLPQLLTREIAAAQVAGNWAKLRGVLQWATRASLTIALGVAAIVTTWLLVSGQGLGSPIGITLLIGVAMVPVVAQGNLRSAALRGLQHIVKGQLPDALIRPAMFSALLFAVALMALTLQPASAMAMAAISAAVALVFANVMLKKALPNAALQSQAQAHSRTWWRDALPMALTEGMRVLQSHLVILLLGLMSTVALVGVYRVASSVTLVMAVPITLFNLVSAPVISRLYAGNDGQRLQRLLSWVAIGMTTSVAVMILPFLFAGHFLLGTVFGSEFADGNSVLLILAVGILSNAFFGANATLLNMTGNQGRVTRASAISLTLLGALLPPLIWLLGMLGAAIGSSLALIAWNVIMWRDASNILTLDTSVISFRPTRKLP